jgi:hypothetical protein
MSLPRCLLVATLAVFGSGSTISAQGSPEFEYRYHTYEETTGKLRALAAAYPNLARLESIGPSATGTKQIWAIEVTNFATGEPETKPAMYVDGNQHDSEVMGGEVALFLVHYLLTRYGTDPDVTRLLDTRTMYVVPLANPDGAEAYITGRIDWDPSTVNGCGGQYPEGKRGADGREDITGDGQILQMRVRDPNGDWKAYGPEPRLLVRRQAGDQASDGPFYRVYAEGYDSNADGEVNSDPPFTRFISNRNYPAFWSSVDGRFRGACDYPLHEHNSRLLVEYITARPNIAVVESYHTTSGVHLRPYAARPDSDIPRRDLEDFLAILAKGTEITGYPHASVYHEFTTIQPDIDDPDAQPGARRGVFIDWAYSHFGSMAFTTELWTMEPFLNEVGWGDIPRDQPLFAIPGRYNRPDVQAKVLQWLDQNRGNPDLAGEGFVEWRRFDHPTLGRVEIGGFTRYWMRNPPPGPYYERVVNDQARFAVVRGLMTPRIRIRDVTVRQVDRSKWTVEATVANEGYLDSSSEHARLVGIARPISVSVAASDGRPLAGSAVAEAVVFAFARGTRDSGVESTYHGSWTFEAPAGTTVVVKVMSEKGGQDSHSVVLGRTAGVAPGPD